MHKTTGNWKMGFGLAAGAALMWGALPIALKVLIESMDAYTISWYRFLVAAMLVGSVLGLRRRLPRLGALTTGRWYLLTVAVVGLCANYLLYVLGLAYISPGTAQIVIQLAPMFLLLGGLIVFKESFGRLQWTGLLILIAGLGLFFNDRVADLVTAFGDYTLGVALIFVSAIVWAAYALAQKQLLKYMSSNAVLMLIYVAAVFLFLPLADPRTLLDLTSAELWLLVFCCFNTVLAYGCFAASLEHWEASRVSAVLAISPLFTILFIAVLGRLVPGFIAPEDLNALSIIGALIVVVGSMMTALGRRGPDSIVAAQPPD